MAPPHRQPPARPRPRPARRRWMWAAVVPVVVLALGGGLLWLRLESNISVADVDAALGGDRPARGPDGSLNILILGSDSRSGKNAEYGEDTGSARSDTAMLVHLPTGRHAATVISIPRDTMVHRPACPLPGGGTAREADPVMFNSVYATGGAPCAVKTVEELGRIRVDHVVDVDFTGFRKLVDALGGVTVTTDRAIHDTYSHLDLPAGTHHLDGERALGLVRTRHGIGDGGDLGRIGLQQKFMAALAGQLHDSGLLRNPVRLYRIADTATSALTTDKALASVRALADLAGSLGGLEPSEIVFRTLPVTTYPPDPNRLAVRHPEAEALFTAIREDTPLPATPAPEAPAPEPEGGHRP
ncbi:LCP family protein (plasmid) [Streptomyces sp. BI20]|uniref:LCP family protein n=1 Tax=Streptomyces sp. BI20 TaxID=3403460 RepID=UPI003C75C634